MSNFCRFANGGAKISIKSYFMEITFFLSSELLDKNASIQSKLPTAACWSREITGKFEANLLYVESESDFGATAGKSFTIFFARGGVEFDR